VSGNARAYITVTPRRVPVWQPRRRLSGRKGLGVVFGSRRSRYYGDKKNEEDTNELDKNFAEHCNVGCGGAAGEGIK